MKAKLLALIVPALAACSLTEVPPPPGSIAINECGEKECRCFRDACVAGSTELNDLLIEITPPATAASMGGLAFYTELPDSENGDLVIGHVAQVTGKVTPAIETDCVFEGPLPDKLAYGVSKGTIPVGLTFIPSASVLGVATAAYPSIAPTLGWMDGEEYQFRANLPPGEYDLYLEPRPPAGDQPGCKFPPYLLRGQEVSVSSTLAVQFPERKSLALTIRLPVDDIGIAGWTVDMLDSRSGRRLSTREIVTASPPPTPDADEYQATLVFIPAHVFDEDGEIIVDPYPVEGSEIIRLSPPENKVAPAFLFQRNALSINDPAVGVIDLRSPESNSAPTSAFPPNVRVEGQTALTGTGAPVEATVTLNASSFEGSDTPAFFVHTEEVDATGRFEILQLPAGTYQVRATPRPGSGLAAAETEWQVRSGQDTVAGKLIELPPASRLSGTVTISQPIGGAPFGASVSAIVSPLSVQTEVLDLARGTSEALPQATTDIVSKNGGFALEADPGTFDVFIRPEARSRYPWFVKPSVDVSADGVHLAKFSLSLPVIYHGRVTVEDGDDTTANATVPGALVRAYAYVTGRPTADGVVPTGAIPVAEARADENGVYELLIPASLDSGQ